MHMFLRLDGSVNHADFIFLGAGKRQGRITHSACLYLFLIGVFLSYNSVSKHGFEATIPERVKLRGSQRGGP